LLLTLFITLLITVNNEHICNVAFINVKSKVGVSYFFISIVVVSTVVQKIMGHYNFLSFSFPHFILLSSETKRNEWQCNKLECLYQICVLS